MKKKDKKMLLFVGAAAAAIYLLTRQKATAEPVKKTTYNPAQSYRPAPSAPAVGSPYRSAVFGQF